MERELVFPAPRRVDFQKEQPTETARKECVPKKLPEAGIIFSLGQHQDGGLSLMQRLNVEFNPQCVISGGTIIF